MPDEYLARLGIGEALATVNFGSESYFAKAEVPLETFSHRLETADKLPTTSQPTRPEQFARAYSEPAAAGASEILAVCVSSQLSGTFNRAVIAAQGSPVPVQVWDKQHISMAAGYRLSTAAELPRDGCDDQSILEALAGIHARLYMAFTPANLRYIVASGRVPQVRGAVGDLLNIKPILTTVGGLLEPVAYVRTQRRAMEQILELLAETIGDRPARVALGHCRAPDEAAHYWEIVRARLNVVEIVQFDLGIVLAAVAGPGLIGLGGYTMEE